MRYLWKDLLLMLPISMMSRAERINDKCQEAILTV
jgi:hypothetical protein